jgi:hypothetical protein
MNERNAITVAAVYDRRTYFTLRFERRSQTAVTEE